MHKIINRHISKNYASYKITLIRNEIESNTGVKNEQYEHKH